MIGCLVLATFLYVVATGPAGTEWLENRRAARRALDDRPLARVEYLPTSSCRTEEL